MQDPNPLHLSTLFTNDLYQFTCSYSYFLSNKHEQTATFQVFFRKYPFGGKYVVLGGIRAVQEFFQSLQFTSQQEEYLLSIFPHIKKDYFQWLRANIRAKVQVQSFKEGEIVFAKEPLITYTGPIGIVQLFETPILNLIGFSSLVATNASRMVKAVEPKSCVEFGLRRAQGPDGGLSASEFAYLGGFIGTSNVHAAHKLGIQCYGTMSHAYVTSFSGHEDIQDFQINGINIPKRVGQIRTQLNLKTHDGQLASFTMFAKSFPNNYVTLIDTYSTYSSGLLNTIIVAKAMVEAGLTKFGIRLDSGDLAQQSIKCRNIWNSYFPEGPRLTILASDDLHEERIVEMQAKGNQIDVFAIGTHIATCKKQPALGLVCKLVDINGIPKMKMSEDGEKATYPSKKNIYRVWTTDKEESCFDVISLENQTLEGTFKVVDPSKKHQIHEIQAKKLKQLNKNWSVSPPHKTINQCRQHLTTTKPQISHTLCLTNPRPHPVLMTESYFSILKQTEEKNRISSNKEQQK